MTLATMLLIALARMSLVIGYTMVIYRVFRGKVRLDATYGAPAPGASVRAA